MMDMAAGLPGGFSTSQGVVSGRVKEKTLWEVF